MTMYEIDQRRAQLGEARAIANNPSRWPRVHGDVAKQIVEHNVLVAEVWVEEALREWWAQDCKEKA